MMLDEVNLLLLDVVVCVVASLGAPTQPIQGI